VLVGNLPPDEELRPLLERMVASVPRPAPDATVPFRTRATVKPLHVSFPKRPVSRCLRLAMVDETCNLRVTFPVRIGGPACTTFEARCGEGAIRCHGLSVVLMLCVLAVGAAAGASSTMRFGWLQGS
jgi:hypothetical protein